MSRRYEYLARQRKALALTAQIDAAFSRLDEVPSAATIRTFSPLMWAAFARLAKTNPPSAETVALVIKHFEDRERDPLEADPIARCGGTI